MKLQSIGLLSTYWLALSLSLSSIADPLRDKFDATVRHFSLLVGLSTIAVAVGVLLEGIEVVHAGVEWWKRKRREKCERIQLEELRRIIPIGDSARTPSRSHPEEPMWAKLILQVGLILVVVGVVGEWRYGAKLEDAHEAVHEYDLAKLTDADQKAGDAAKSAKIAKDAADGAVSDFLVLRSLVSARHILPAKRAAFIGRLRQLSGTTVIIESQNGEPEAEAFCKALAAAMQSPTTGITPLVACGARGGAAIPAGVIIKGPDFSASESIAKAIRDASGTIVIAQPRGAGDTDNRLWIFVGPKNPFWIEP
jgi:hypothetical protein